MTIAQFFDDVAGGISSAETFLARISQPLELLFGATPLSVNLAQLFTSIQQDCANVKILADGAQQSLVMTDTVYQQAVSYVGEVAKLMMGDPTNVGTSRATMIEEIVAEVLKAGIPLVLSVVAPGSGPILTLAEATLNKLVPMLV
jgi:hypothetical protein